MSSTLFPEPAPAPASSEPPIWVRRLVLIRTLEPAAEIIRDIPFGLGVNLVVTRQPPSDSTESLGHDVGKTLLTRLIRYLLGEPRFADGRTRSAIRATLPDSLVVGEFRVGGEDWAVVRPLGAPSTFPSRAARAASWRQLLDGPRSDSDFAAFVQVVRDAVLAPISSPLLTHERRPVDWTDILSWIARDQKCRYVHPLVWRHPEADSGTAPLHTEDASTVLRSTCGLMDDREKKLFEDHDILLHQRQSLAQEKVQLERHLGSERASLEHDLRDLLKDDSIGISEIELEIVRGKASNQKSLRADQVAKLRLPTLRAERDAANQSLADSRAEEKALDRQVQTAQEHLQRRRSRSPTVYESLATLCDRQVDDCPLKLKIANQQVPSPDVDDIAELAAELQTAKQRLATVRASQGHLRTRLSECTTALDAAELDLTTATEGIDRLIALFEAMAARVERFLKRSERLPEFDRKHDELTRQINESLQKQSELRDALSQSRAWLPARFAELCKELLGSNRDFLVQIESKAIRLQIVGANGTPGEATSTSGLVLCLDLAALRAAVDGYGHHPRFGILDSPREADMELGIFNRLVQRLVAWHNGPGSRRFQLIVTTTTRPLDAHVPAELIRLELARSPATSLLLGVEL